MNEASSQRAVPPTPTEQTCFDMRETLGGRRRGLRQMLPFAGPAVVASIAYMDPGNFATNMAGGAKFGYLLLWVVLVANLMAMLIQTLSAKIGLVTGRTSPSTAASTFPSRSSSSCGCSWRSWRCPPTWPSFSERPWDSSS